MLVTGYASLVTSSLLKANRRRSRTTTSRGRGAGCSSAAAQGPAFAERRAVADLDRDALAALVQFHPKRIGFVERDRIIRVIVRNENVHRFTRREHTTAHVALLTRMISRPKNFFEHLGPILRGLIIHLHDRMPNDRWSDAFVGEGKMNRPIAALEFQDGPDRGTHLLALHVSGVSRNRHSQQSNKGRDDCVVSAGRALGLLLRHGADHIAGEMSVN